MRKREVWQKNTKLVLDNCKLGFICYKLSNANVYVICKLDFICYKLSCTKEICGL